MSRVKKSIVYFVVLALTLVTLAGCGTTEKENEFVGSWEVSGGKVNGVSLPKEQIKEQLGAISLKIKKDGTVTKEGIGLDAVGVWKESKDGITVSEKDGANKVLFKREGDKLAGNIKGIEVVLKK